MGFSRWKNLFVILIMMAMLTSGIAFNLQFQKYLLNQPEIFNNLAAALSLQSAPVVALPPPQKLSNPPEIIKAVYVTGYSAGAKKYLDYLSNLFNTTEINAVVVDIKDYSGMVSYNSATDNVAKYNLYNNAIPNIDALVRFFHNKKIYIIGRIAVFEDLALATARSDLAVYDAKASEPVLWKDNNGLSWLDPSAKEVWDYNISLAKDAFLHGFDELNFDYVRFPSDGETENMGFPVWEEKTPRPEVIKEFFEYTRKQLKGEKISVDLFGQTTVNTDDMGIGQIIENAFENFDYVSPMVYPSHYINGFIGFSNPAEHPYEVVKYSLDSAASRQAAFAPNGASAAKIRPWLQDFNMGADYTADMVGQEIQATQDSLGNNYVGYMIWNPSNIYNIMQNSGY